MNAFPSPRHLALDMLLAVIDQGESLSAVTPRLLPRIKDPRDRALAYRLTHNALRQLNRLIWLRDQLLDRPLKGKDSDVATLLLLGISQLCHPDLPAHASIHETVQVARRLKKPWAVGLTNAILRSFQRRQTELTAQADAQTSLYHRHPRWLIDRLHNAWPDHWQQILAANNRPARLCLRLKPDIARDAFIKALPKDLNAKPHPHLKQAVLLDSTDVTQLPGFNEGQFSVQDASAQWASHLLAPQPGERLLDACAAPGGKTTHLQELTDNRLLLTALDVDAKRLARVQDNLDRLHLSAKLILADAAATDQWWDGQLFDAILLDAPCSATGIIRRHPDIKWHRKAHDILQLTQTQARLLDQLWPLVKPGGRLLYTTCSVLPDENSQQIASFLSRTANARLQTPPCIPQAVDTGMGQQLLPTDADGGDGFFYALLTKNASSCAGCG